ncbi:MAG: hypothetical protein JWO53_629 [Chlamydiia bacterium]|nr:hypothetical protein [Chlamydiia bacterium]
MLRSMTAYSRVKKSFPEVEVAIELQSVNKRYLEIQMKLPPELYAFDIELRKMLSQRISRGNITLNVQLSFVSEQAFDVRVNLPLAKKLHGAIQSLVQELAIPNADILTHILKERGILQVETIVSKESSFKQSLEEVLDEACKALILMKEREGERITAEFKERIVLLEQLIREIALRSADAPLRHRAKLIALFTELFTEGASFDERLAKEVALVADKSDISEEISRFTLHLHHFLEVLSQKESQGKTLEFILQELQREINTIGSKSQEGAISHLVIAAKSEIEKIREQVQNVE